MEKVEVIITTKDGKTIRLKNVNQISKYDISDNVLINMSIPLKEIKNYYVVVKNEQKK